MRLTLRDEAGPNGSSLPSAADVASGRYPLVSRTSTDSIRHRYVVGIFKAPPEAYRAATALAPGACDVLVVLNSTPRRETEATTVSEGRLIIHHLDTSAALAANLAAALTKFGEFAVLGSDPRGPEGAVTAPSGTQRLFQNLVHHLAAGAAGVIVRAPDPEHQLQVSRALLEAKCDVLLTHDVVQAAGCASTEPAPVDDCCENCTSQACRRVDAPRNGTARGKE
jgi:hypothetical protein